MVNVSANETVLTSSMVHQNRFVLEFSGQELALHYPGKLTVSVNPEQDGLFRARLYEDLPVSLRLDDYSSRWLGEGLLVFSRIEPVRVQVIKDLVRVRVLTQFESSAGSCCYLSWNTGSNQFRRNC